MLKKILTTIGFLLVPAVLYAATVATFTVRQGDLQIRTFFKILSGTPIVTVVGRGPNESDPVPLGTMDGTNPSLSFVGPFETLEMTISGTGHGEVSWIGRTGQ